MPSNTSQRPSGHRDEPCPSRVLAVPKGDATQPKRHPLAGARSIRAVLWTQQPIAVHPALSRRLLGWNSMTSRLTDSGDRRPLGIPSMRIRVESRSPLGRSAKALPTRWEWQCPPADCADCWIRMPGRAPRFSITTSTASPPMATSRRASPPRLHRWPPRSDSASHPHLRQQPDLHRGRHQDRAHRGHHRPLCRIRLVQTVDWTHGDAHHYQENVAALAEVLRGTGP